MNEAIKANRCRQSFRILANQPNTNHMTQKYTVADHGDLLEKKGATFIRDKFPNYELVWQTYIGNTGDATRALLPHYPDEKKRESFAEHSYTTFESCFMIQELLSSRIFTADIPCIQAYIQFNQSFILFFAYLGRIHDMVLKAARDLGHLDGSFEKAIKVFYEARNIVLHGKKVPIMLDNDGYLVMPILQTRYAKGNAWNDEGNSWPDSVKMATSFPVDTCEAYFNELMQTVNAGYGQFYGVIASELSEIQTQLVFDRSNEGLFSKSWSNQVTPVSASNIFSSGIGSNET
jgi:hypothetical protein